MSTDTGNLVPKNHRHVKSDGGERKTAVDQMKGNTETLDDTLINEMLLCFNVSQQFPIYIFPLLPD